MKSRAKIVVISLVIILTCPMVLLYWASGTKQTTVLFCYEIRMTFAAVFLALGLITRRLHLTMATLYCFGVATLLLATTSPFE